MKHISQELYRKKRKLEGDIISEEHNILQLKSSIELRETKVKDYRERIEEINLKSIGEDNARNGKYLFSQRSKLDFVRNVMDIDVTKEMIAMLNGYKLNNGRHTICERGEMMEVVVENLEIKSIKKIED